MIVRAVRRAGSRARPRRRAYDARGCAARRARAARSSSSRRDAVEAAAACVPTMTMRYEPVAACGAPRPSSARCRPAGSGPEQSSTSSPSASGCGCERRARRIGAARARLYPWQTIAADGYDSHDRMRERSNAAIRKGSRRARSRRWSASIAGACRPPRSFRPSSPRSSCEVSARAAPPGRRADRPPRRDPARGRRRRVEDRCCPTSAVCAAAAGASAACAWSTPTCAARR